MTEVDAVDYLINTSNELYDIYDIYDFYKVYQDYLFASTNTLKKSYN